MSHLTCLLISLPIIIEASTPTVDSINSWRRYRCQTRMVVHWSNMHYISGADLSDYNIKLLTKECTENLYFAPYSQYNKQQQHRLSAMSSLASSKWPHRVRSLKPEGCYSRRLTLTRGTKSSSGVRNWDLERINMCASPSTTKPRMMLR